MYSKIVLFCVVLYVTVVVSVENDENMATITVFGSTGKIGKKVLEAAVEKGYKARAFTRSAKKFSGQLRNHVEVIEGDLLKQDDVDRAVAGTDYVVIAIGKGEDLSPTTDLSEGTKHIISAMKKHNVTIVSVCLSLFLYPEEKFDEIYVPVTDDHRRMYDALRDSGLNYIPVFAGWFTDDTPKGDMLIELNGTKAPAKYTNEKALAEFLVDSLKEPKYYKNIVGLSNP